MKNEDTLEHLSTMVADVEYALKTYGPHGRVPILSDPRRMDAPAAEFAVELCRRLHAHAIKMAAELERAKLRACEVLPAGLAWKSESTTEIIAASDTSYGSATTEVLVVIAVTARAARIKRQRAASVKTEKLSI